MKKIFVLIAVCFVFFNFVSCGCKHEWKEATCTEPKTCSICGKTKGNVAPHVKERGETIVDATCDTEGKFIYRCKFCGIEIVEGIIEPYGHSYSEWKTVKGPTCSEDGKKERICSKCGKIEEGIIEKSHNYNENNVCVLCNEYAPVYLSLSSSEKEASDSIQYIKESKIQKAETGFTFLIGMADANDNYKGVPCYIDIRIEDLLGNVVYKARKILGTKDFGNWSSKSKGTRLLGSVNIDVSEIEKGKTSSGKLYFRVFLKGGSFKELSVDIEEGIPFMYSRSNTIWCDEFTFYKDLQNDFLAKQYIGKWICLKVKVDSVRSDNGKGVLTASGDQTIGYGGYYQYDSYYYSFGFDEDRVSELKYVSPNKRVTICGLFEGNANHTLEHCFIQY